VKRARGFVFLVVGAASAVGACGHDWEALEPTSATSTSTSGADGGAGGATSTTATTSPPASASTSTASAGGAPAGTGGASASTGVGGGTGAAATTGAGGGSCGDGIVDPGEECDDMNDVDGDGCTNCLVDCGLAADEATHTKFGGHCYWLLPAARNPTDATCSAGTQAYVHLAALTTAAELTAIGSFVGATASAWTGGTYSGVTSGTRAWSDGETWTADDDAALTGMASLGPTCLSIQANGSLSYEAACGTSLPVVCERPPPGQK
jgi:cysteine-rich repeat protein